MPDIEIHGYLVSTGHVQQVSSALTGASYQKDCEICVVERPWYSGEGQLQQGGVRFVRVLMSEEFFREWQDDLTRRLHALGHHVEICPLMWHPRS